MTDVERVRGLLETFPQLKHTRDAFERIARRLAGLEAIRESTTEVLTKLAESFEHIEPADAEHRCNHYLNPTETYADFIARVVACPRCDQ